jgi:P2-related tail formation protein
VHSRRGTKWAVEQLVSSYFSDGFVKEWYEEGYENPKPFHFTVYTSFREATDRLMQEFEAITKLAMSARSRLDGVNFSDTFGGRVVAGSTTTAFSFISKKCGTLKCGE